MFLRNFSSSLEPAAFLAWKAWSDGEIKHCIRTDIQIVATHVATSVAEIVRHFPLVGNKLLIPGPPPPRRSSLPSAATAPLSGSLDVGVTQQPKGGPLACQGRGTVLLRNWDPFCLAGGHALPCCVC